MTHIFTIPRPVRRYRVTYIFDNGARLILRQEHCEPILFGGLAGYIIKAEGV